MFVIGHGSDASTMQPPRGLQFILGTNRTPAMVDTIVMANLVGELLQEKDFYFFIYLYVYVCIFKNFFLLHIFRAVFILKILFIYLFFQYKSIVTKN